MLLPHLGIAATAELVLLPIMVKEEKEDEEQNPNKGKILPLDCLNQ